MATVEEGLSQLFVVVLFVLWYMRYWYLDGLEKKNEVDGKV